MTLSPRLTRAAFAFLLFGTAAALLPAQDNAALAGNGCFTGPPGTTGQYAIAPTISDIQDAYALTSIATAYKYYYRPNSASSYGQVSAGSNTTIVVNSGQVLINKKPYSTTNQPLPSTGSSFQASQVVTSYNSYGLPTGHAAGNVTVTSTYVGSDLTGHQDTYTAVVTLSAPASTF